MEMKCSLNILANLIARQAAKHYHFIFNKTAIEEACCFTHSHAFTLNKMYIVRELPCSSKPNVVREYGGVVDVVITMNSINPINHRNSQTCCQGTFLEFIYHVDPHCRCGLRSRDTPTTT